MEMEMGKLMAESNDGMENGMEKEMAEGTGTCRGTVEIQAGTTQLPISMIGEEAGICWGADVSDPSKNHRRGVDCIKSMHGRTLEFPQVYMVLDGWSAKCVREFYTHIGGSPTRLQASTRYIDYSKGLEVSTPDSVARIPEARRIWDECVGSIAPAISKLKELGVPNEDATNLLPLAYRTKVVVRTNLRNLMDMAALRLCRRAYHEYRCLMSEIVFQLEQFSDEWEELVYDLRAFRPRCEILGRCPESKSCGRFRS